MKSRRSKIDGVESGLETMQGRRDATSSETLEALIASSLLLDMANGLEEEKSLATGLVARALAEAAGFDAEQQRDAFFVGLLRHLGCTAFAAFEATLAPDDIALRRALIHAPPSTVGRAVAAVTSAHDGWVGKARRAVGLLLAAPNLRGRWTHEVCEAGATLAARLPMPAPVCVALTEIFERWDGAGAPRRLVGDGISPLGRIGLIAHLWTIAELSMGRTHATEVVAARAGTELDPKLAAIARELPPTDIDASLAAMEALFSARSLPLTLEAIVEAFAEFSDLQIPHKLGHGREVGLLASAAAEALGLPPIDRRDVEWAARLHDVGQVAIPTGSWCSSRARRPSETARQQTHAAIGERVFATCGSLARVGSLVGTHHERLDGSGYPRARTALALARGARIVAAADVWSALRAERPWRAAMSVAAAARVMGQEVSAGRLDGAVVEAILAHAGVVRSRWANAASTSIGAVSLSERERQVLAVLARGATNKEIAQRLGISARTVQHHTLHIYEKLGVSTRAGAATAASRLGLLGLDAEG